MNLNKPLECINLATSFCASGRQWGSHLNRMSLRCESLLFCTIKPSFLLVFRFFSIFQIPFPNPAAQVVATPIPLGHIFLDCCVPMFPCTHCVLYGSIIFHLSSLWLFIMLFTLIHKFSTYCTCVPQQHHILSHIICTKVLIKLPL